MGAKTQIVFIYDDISIKRKEKSLLEPVIYNFRLDVAKSGKQVGIVMKAGDRASRKLRITLVNGGSAFIPQEGHTASLKAEKPDGTILLNACEVINGMIEYEVTEQTLAVPGTVSCEVTCYGADGEVLCTPGFEIYAERKVYEDDLIESKDEFTTLSGALGRVSSVEANENARQEAEAERQEVFDESIRLANVAAERANAAADAYDGLLEGADWPPHASSHAIGGRDQITPSMIGAQPVGNYLTGESDPTVPSWAKQPTKPSYTAEEVGALDADTYKAADPATVKRAAEAVKLETPRKIGNASFDGSEDVPIDSMGVQPASLYLQNVLVGAASWADDTTYSDYPYRSAIAIDGVSAENYAEATYAPAEQSSGNYAGVVDTYDGGVYVYAKALPPADITIPTIKVEAAGSGNVSGGGTGGSGGESETWELIAEGEVEEDVETITVTEDTEGKSINLKKVAVYAILYSSVASAAKNIRYVSGNLSADAGTAANVYEDKAAMLYGYAEVTTYGTLQAFVVPVSNAAFYSTTQLQAAATHYIPGFATNGAQGLNALLHRTTNTGITEIGMSKSIKTGSAFKIYGVRA